MTDGEDINRVVDEIAERVRQRLQGNRAELPSKVRTFASAQPPEPAAERQCECQSGCKGCGGFDSCNTVTAVNFGVSRISPDRVRTSADIAPYIDHTLLKPDATREEIVKVSEEAEKYGFATVCMSSGQVGTAARVLAGSRTVPIAVVGFPLGAALPTAKAFEAREAIRCGAQEIDMVINIGALKAKDYALVMKDS